MIVISHDSDFVWESASHVVAITQGVTRKEGEPDSIYTDEQLVAEAGLSEPVELNLLRLRERAFTRPLTRSARGEFFRLARQTFARQRPGVSP